MPLRVFTKSKLVDVITLSLKEKMMKKGLEHASPHFDPYLSSYLNPMFLFLIYETQAIRKSYIFISNLWNTNKKNIF